MAYVANIFSSSYTTLAIHDYAGTPNTHSVGEVVVNTAIAPLQENVGKEEVMVNTSGGAAKYATPWTGESGGDAYTIRIVEADTKNDTDEHSLSLFRALADNTLASTGFSGWTTTSPQTGGSDGPTTKFVFTQRNTAGTTHILTCPTIVQSAKRELDGNHFVITVECLLVGAVTVA